MLTFIGTLETCFYEQRGVFVFFPLTIPAQLTSELESDIRTKFESQSFFLFFFLHINKTLAKGDKIYPPQNCLVVYFYIISWEYVQILHSGMSSLPAWGNEHICGGLEPLGEANNVASVF